MSIIVPDRSLEAPIDPRPFPLDERIGAGLEIVNGLSSDDLIIVADRFEQVLAEMRTDDTKEFGACIAYAAGALSKRVQQQLEMTLVETGQRQNHGLVQCEPQFPKESRLNLQKKHHAVKDALWAGVDGDMKFTLYRSVGFLAMSDSSTPEGTVWSLHGTRRAITIEH